MNKVLNYKREEVIRDYTMYDEYPSQGYTDRYFKITITNPNTHATNEKAGFIDPLKATEYTDFNGQGTLEQYKAKGLGYIRWLNLCLSLSKYGIFFLQDNKKVGGATSTTVPTSIEVLVGYNQADKLELNAPYRLEVDIEPPEAVVNFKVTPPTEPEFVDTEVIKYWVAYAMTHNHRSFVHVFDPTIPTGGKNPAGLPMGVQDLYLTAEKICDTMEIANQNIVVEEVDNPVIV